MGSYSRQAKRAQRSAEDALASLIQTMRADLDTVMSRSTERMKRRLDEVTSALHAVAYSRDQAGGDAADVSRQLERFRRKVEDPRTSREDLAHHLESLKAEISRVTGLFDELRREAQQALSDGQRSSHSIKDIEMRMSECMAKWQTSAKRVDELVFDMDDRGQPSDLADAIKAIEVEGFDLLLEDDVDQVVGGAQGPELIDRLEPAREVAERIDAEVDRDNEPQPIG